jgi:hypothetical protein
MGISSSNDQNVFIILDLHACFHDTPLPHFEFPFTLATPVLPTVESILTLSLPSQEQASI